jgi:integrase/recombinase XerD
VREFLAWLALQTVNVNGQIRHHGPPALHQHCQVLKTWSAWLTSQGVYPKGDPLARLRTPKLPQPEIPSFSRKQMTVLIALCARTRHPLKNAAILGFLYDTGVRVSELCDLTLSDVQMPTANTSGRAHVLGKGRKRRTVYFGAKCGLAVQRYLASDERVEAPWLFCGRGAGQLRRQVVQDLLRRVGEDAGITGVRLSPHTVRHAMARQYLRDNPGQISQLMRLLGHNSTAMTQHYARLAQEDVEGHYRSPLDGLS